MRRDKLIRTLLLLYVCTLALVRATAADHVEELTLERALALAEESHPELLAARAEAEAAKARRAQAGKLPNPEAVARIESAPFNRRTTDSAEYVGGVSQAVPLGGRLSAATEVAQREIEGAEARIELRRRELHARVHTAFAMALYFDAALTAFSNNLAGAEALTRIAKARVTAGDALREELARAEIEEVQMRLEWKVAEAARLLAVTDLVVALGNSSLRIVTLRGSLTNVLALADIESMAAEWAESPAIAVAESEVAAQQARVRLAKAQRIPDINFDLFYRRLQETRKDAFDTGMRIPIPLFANAKAKIREATAEANAAEARMTNVRLETEQRVRRARVQLQRALESARVISGEILPRAQIVLSDAEARYKAGEASLADVLQKRRDWTATQSKYLQALREVHEAWRTLKTDGPAR